MTKRFVKRFFPILAILLLTPWPVSYAYSYYGDIATQDTIRIKVAEASMAPSWTVFGGEIGSVSIPGDLFYIDATNNVADILVTLYITNTQELMCCYKYMILKVGIYVESNYNEWERASGNNGEPIPDTFVTMRNSQVSFTLRGYTKYRISIDSGSYYCLTVKGNGDIFSPQFYLTVN